MMKSVKIKLLALICLSIFSMNLYAENKKIKPTIILVHGALFNSSGWIPVQSYLQNNGYNVVTLDVPGRAEDGVAPSQISLDVATQKVCKVVELQHGPVILVGHSQGGALITQALDECSANIKGLIYVAAVVPLNGEHVFQMLNDQDNANFNQCATLDEQAGLYKVNPTGPLKEMFMADASSIQADRALHNVTDEPALIGDGVLHYDEKKFNAVPKFYLKTLNDKIISPATQNAILAKVSMTAIYSMPTGHSPFVSQPQLLGKYIAKIVDEVNGA